MATISGFGAEQLVQAPDISGSLFRRGGSAAACPALWDAQPEPGPRKPQPGGGAAGQFDAGCPAGLPRTAQGQFDGARGQESRYGRYSEFNGRRGCEEPGREPSSSGPGTTASAQIATGAARRGELYAHPGARVRDQRIERVAKDAGERSAAGRAAAVANGDAKRAILARFVVYDFNAERAEHANAAARAARRDLRSVVPAVEHAAVRAAVESGVDRAHRADRDVARSVGDLSRSDFFVFRIIAASGRSVS